VAAIGSSVPFVEYSKDPRNKDTIDNGKTLQGMKVWSKKVFFFCLVWSSVACDTTKAKRRLVEVLVQKSTRCTPGSSCAVWMSPTIYDLSRRVTRWKTWVKTFSKCISSKLLVIHSIVAVR